MPQLSFQNWPIDPSGKNAFYGNPGIGGPDPAWKAANLVPYIVPWSGKSVLVHRLVRDSLDRILTQYWNEIGRDQSVVAHYGLADVETYNYRQNRNDKASLSNHSYGIAVDIAPSHNENGTHWVDGGIMLPRRLIELFKFEGWRWGGDFGTTSSGAEHGTKDPMHFEAVFDQHHDQPPVPAPQSIDGQQLQNLPGTASAGDTGAAQGTQGGGAVDRMPPLGAAPAIPILSTGTAPAPLVALAEAAATLVARQLISASPQAAQAAAELRAQAMIGREIADLVIALLDKVAPIPATPVARLPTAQTVPPLPSGPLPPFLAPPATAMAPRPTASANDRFSKCVALTLKWEGGNDDDPRDPGGRTSRGIIQREWDVWRQSHPGLPSDVWRAPQDQVLAIYKANYWDKLDCDNLPAGVDYAVFDYGVNSGIGRAAKAFQELVGMTAGGAIGPQTLMAVGQANPVNLVGRLCDERLAFLKGLRTWPTFGRGWTNRVEGVRKDATAMAMATMNQGTTPMNNQDQNTGVTGLPDGVTVGGSPFGSKVNITAAAACISALVLYFTSGKLDLKPEQVAGFLTLISTLAPIAIMLFRTFATTTVFTHSLPKQ